MKPRLRVKGGVWSCASKLVYPWVIWRIGFGYTPLEAWHDWKRQEVMA